MKNKLFLLAIFCSFLALPALAVQFANPIKYGTIPEVINAIVDFIMIVSIPLLTGAVVYGAYLMITNGGDAKKFSDGWKSILYAIAGFIVVLLSKGIALAVQNFFR